MPGRRPRFPEKKTACPHSHAPVPLQLLGPREWFLISCFGRRDPGTVAHGNAASFLPCTELGKASLPRTALAPPPLPPALFSNAHPQTTMLCLALPAPPPRPPVSVCSIPAAQERRTSAECESRRDLHCGGAGRFAPQGQNAPGDVLRFRGRRRESHRRRSWETRPSVPQTITCPEGLYLHPVRGSGTAIMNCGQLSTLTVETIHRVRPPPPLHRRLPIVRFS